MRNLYITCIVALSSALHANSIINHHKEKVSIKIEPDNDANAEKIIEIGSYSSIELENHIPDYHTFKTFTITIMDDNQLLIRSVNKHPNCEAVITNNKSYAIQTSPDCHITD